MSVYFITCREANAVKIGSSLEPHGRLPEIQHSCPLPLTLEAVLPGGREEELAFHRRFEDDRIRGEWFTITAIIETIIAANPPPPPPAKLDREAQLKQRRAQRARDREAKRTAPPLVPWALRRERSSKRYDALLAEMRAEQEPGA